MVNKREKIYCIISISDKRLSSFFIFFNFSPFHLLFSSFFPTFFVLILSYLSGTRTFFLADISWRNFLSSWTFLSGTFFPGGGDTRAPSAPPVYAPAAHALQRCCDCFALMRCQKPLSCRPLRNADDTTLRFGTCMDSLL